MDQLFSILANEFKGEILTVDDLVDKILNATGMTPKPECRQLWYIFGWKTYVDDILANTPLQNHSRFNLKHQPRALTSTGNTCRS